MIAQLWLSAICVTALRAPPGSSSSVTVIARRPLPLLRIVIVALVSPLTGCGQVMVSTTESPRALAGKAGRADRGADIGAAVAAGRWIEAELGADLL